jgi:hypothetical protein
MVRHRKVPNLAKNCRLQAKSGSDACMITHTHTHTASQCLLRRLLAFAASH